MDLILNLPGIIASTFGAMYSGILSSLVSEEEALVAVVVEVVASVVSYVAEASVLAAAAASVVEVVGVAAAVGIE